MVWPWQEKLSSKFRPDRAFGFSAGVVEPASVQFEGSQSLAVRLCLPAPYGYVTN